MKRAKTPFSTVVFFPVFGHSVGVSDVSTRGAPRRKPGANGKRGAVPFKSRSARGGGRRREENAPFFADNWDFFRNSRGLFGTSRRVFAGAEDGAASGREEDANPHLLRGAPGDGVPRGGVWCRDAPRRRVIFGAIRARRAPYAGRRAAFRRGNFVYQPKSLKFAD